MRERPEVELTRRSGSGHRLDATELAEILVNAVAERCAGLPYEEVLERLRTALGEASLAMTSESLHAIARSISRGDEWATHGAEAIVDQGDPNH